MKKNYRLALFIVIMGGCFVLGVGYANAQDDMHQHMQHQQMSQQLKVGRTAEVQFLQPTRIGDLVLPAGEYSFVHLVEGENHFVQFTLLKDDGNNVHVREVKCRIEPLGRTLPLTAIPPPWTRAEHAESRELGLPSKTWRMCSNWKLAGRIL